ncbi:MAG: TOMM precursor leader peptide-binding protein [Marinifilaceae bacterium]
MIENFDIFRDEQQNGFQCRTKSDSYLIEFDDSEKEEIFLDIVAEIQSKPNIVLKKIIKKVKNDTNEAKVISVLKTLDDYGLLSYDLARELSPDSDQHKGQVITTPQPLNVSLVVFGQGPITDKIKNQALAENFSKVSSYSYNKDVDIEKIVSDADFLIVDANEWSPYHVESINKFALKHNKPWLYVGGIEETSIKVGPLFYGKETGCYNCLISRIKSNHEYPEFLNSYEDFLRRNKKGAKVDSLPSADTIYNIVANFTILEVMKFVQGWSLPDTWRCLICIDIMNLNLTKHTLLKVPYCDVCKPQLEYNPSPWLEAITLK